MAVEHISPVKHMFDTIQMLVRRARRTAAGNAIDTSVFIPHVPKCGGTSIKNALAEAYGLRAGIQIDLRGNIHHDAFSMLDPFASKKAADQLGVPLHVHREHVLLHLMGLPNRKLISGHFHFSEAAYREYYSRYTFVTLIRDPVERWYSQYFYNRDKKGTHFAVEDALEEYVCSPTGRSTGSSIAQYFAGSDCGAERIVECAITNLGRFDVVGVLEELNVFKRELKHALGANINIPIRNTSPTPADQKRREITPEIHRKVVELCKPDREVYDYVVKELK